MKKIFFLAALLAATSMMAQTTKKSFTLDDLMPGGSTFWNLQPKYMFSTWWGEVPVELTVDEAKRVKSEKVKSEKSNHDDILFTADDLNAILGEKIVRACTNLTFPYADQPVVKVQTPKEIILIDFAKKENVEAMFDTVRTYGKK